MYPVGNSESRPSSPGPASSARNARARPARAGSSEWSPCRSTSRTRLGSESVPAEPIQDSQDSVRSESNGPPQRRSLQVHRRSGLPFKRRNPANPARISSESGTPTLMRPYCAVVGQGPAELPIPVRGARKTWMPPLPMGQPPAPVSHWSSGENARSESTSPTFRTLSNS